MPELQEIGMQVRFVVFLNNSSIGKGAESGAESKMAKTILKQLSKGAFSKKQIADLFGKKSPSGHLNKLIRGLVDEGVIEYTSPEKPNSQLQKYQLTQKGKKLLS